MKRKTGVLPMILASVAISALVVASHQVLSKILYEVENGLIEDVVMLQARKIVSKQAHPLHFSSVLF